MDTGRQAGKQADRLCFYPLPYSTRPPPLFCLFSFRLLRPLPPPRRPPYTTLTNATQTTTLTTHAAIANTPHNNRSYCAPAIALRPPT